MAKLSENEIIKIISDDIIGYQVGYEEYEEAVKGLLDLYKQEKDRNIELDTTIDALNTDLKQEKENYKRLSIEAQATAFDEDNKDTEGLCRVLLKQGQITLENGEYKRKDFDWEQNLCELGLMKKREKMFYITDDECLDEYTKQLEIQLKEYQKLKEIFRKYNITNETMYDGVCRLENELEQEKEKNKELIQGQVETIEKLIQPELFKKYMSKDKIKAKIEEAENKLVEKRKEKYRTIYEIALEYYIEAYKELLEE